VLLLLLLLHDYMTWASKMDLPFSDIPALLISSCPFRLWAEEVSPVLL
jgi:hypothetical protein